MGKMVWMGRPLHELDDKELLLARGDVLHAKNLTADPLTGDELTPGLWAAYDEDLAEIDAERERRDRNLPIGHPMVDGEIWGG